MRAKEVEMNLEFALLNKENILMVGPPGVGKTDMFKQAVTKLGYDSMIVHPVVEDPTDPKGLPWVKDGKAVFLPLPNMERMINATRPLGVLIDDLGQSAPMLQAAYMQILLAKEINGMPISPFVRFAAATNRREDKSGVSGILEAVKSRFGLIVDVEVNVEDWLLWAHANGMPYELTAFIQFKPEMLWDWKPAKDIVNQPCPRTVAKVGTHMINGRNFPYWKKIESSAFAGAAGIVFSTQFRTFLNVFLTLPTIGQIEADPTGTIIPTEISAKFAITNMIVHHITQQNANALIKYMDRLPMELGMSAIKAIVVKNPIVCNTAGFGNWMIKHGTSMMELN